MHFLNARILLVAIVTVISLQPSPATASPDSLQSELQANYARVNLAAEIKYLDGVVCCRSDYFVGYNADGTRLDENFERNQLAQSFRGALSVKDKTRILSLQTVSSTRVVCQVQDVLEITIPATLPKLPNVLQITAFSSDEWSKEKDGWRITSSRVSKLSSETHPAVPAGAKSVPSSSPTAR